jgi:F0F1-type ATP synthase membrane subunit b/b'
MSELILPTINLTILITIMVVYLRAPIRGYVSSRHESIRDELRRVRDLLAGAKTKYEEFSSKLKAMEAEIQSLRDQARQDAAAMQSKILAEAQSLSATLVADARKSAQGMYGQLKRELFVEVGGKVLVRAEQMLRERLTGDDRARIRHEFSSQVESVQ